MTALDSMSALGVLGVGVILALINVKQLGIYVGGVAQIVHADVSTAQRWVALVVLLVLIQVGVIAPIVVYAVARGWATRQLLRFRGWLVRSNRVIGIVLGLVIGTWFTIKGITQIT
jgi:threonine/homoserine/homoserine lactone efflux protein